MSWLVVVGITAVGIWIIWWTVRTVRRINRWKEAFKTDASMILSALEDPARERVARLLLLAGYGEGYPREIRELLEYYARAEEGEVWEQHGL